MKAFQIIAKEHNTVIANHFVFAEDEEEAREMVANDNDIFYSKEVLKGEGNIVEINEMECRIKKEEENEYTKNYPKRPLD